MAKTGANVDRRSDGSVDGRRNLITECRASARARDSFASYSHSPLIHEFSWASDSKSGPLKTQLLGGSPVRRIYVDRRVLNGYTWNMSNKAPGPWHTRDLQRRTPRASTPMTRWSASHLPGLADSCRRHADARHSIESERGAAREERASRARESDRARGDITR